jgi:4'-phosphopantetheinyl transferase
VIEIWIEDLDNLDLAMLEQSPWVSKERRQKADRLKSIETKKASLAGEYLLGYAFSQLKEKKKLPEKLDKLSFPVSYQKNQYGAPYLPGNPLYFNWSHSGNKIALAVSDVPVGIDIQKKKEVRDGVARKYYPQTIWEKLKTLEGEEKETLFFRYWTLLEAWLKARGCGFYGYENPEILQNKNNLQNKLLIENSGTLVGKDKKQWEYQFYETDFLYVCCIVTKKEPHFFERM